MCRVLLQGTLQFGNTCPSCLTPFLVGIRSDNWPFAPFTFPGACLWSLMCFSSFHWVQAFQAFSTMNFDRLYRKLYKNQQNKCIDIVSSGILTSMHVFRIKIQSAVLPNWTSGMRLLSIAHRLILVIKTMRFLSIAQ